MPRNKRKRHMRAADAESDESDEEVPKMPRRHCDRIFFYCDVNKKTVLEMARLLDEYAVEASARTDKPTVWLYIHSDGGYLHAGISAMGHVKRFRGVVKTVADGFVASAATLLLLAGDTRYIVPHSQVLIHQLRTGFEGKYDELADEYRNSAGLMSSMIHIYQTHTEIPQKVLETCLKGERCLDELQCLKYAIVDRVLS